jgi:hypothetical protein
MSRVLSELLDEPEVVVESVIKKLEHMSGWESTDVRLLAEVNNRVRTKMSELGLDADDTTGHELFHALRAKLEKDEASINLPKDELIYAIAKAHKGYEVYALKNSVAKDLLRKHPPKKLMKELSYRSIDSMLKRENICGLYSVLDSVESPRWLNVFYKDLAKLTPSDFETKSVEITGVTQKYAALINNEEPVFNVPLLGSVVFQGGAISKIGLCMAVSENINELRSLSAHIKLKNVEANFGNDLVDIIKNGSEDPLKIGLLPISWKTIFHHYGLRTASEHTEFFGPHLLHEDIKTHNSVKALAQVSPIFKWWQDLEYAAKKTEQGIVSLNLLDVISNRAKTYEQRSLDYVRVSLWHEFVNRYLAHPSVEQHFMQQLEPQTVPVIDLRPSEEAPEKDIARMVEVGI